MTGGTSSETCEGCCEAIYDRFVMRVGNLSWHEDCLFCSDCHTQLITSCYFKESRLLCRMDYEKRFGVKCGRCGQFLSSQDLVMRTLHNVFHLHCFVCAVCCRPLTRGDQYVVRAGQVVCRADYEKEYFMVQGFSPPELLQDGQQGITDDFVVESTGRQRDGRRGPKRPRTILTAAQRRQFKASFDVSPKPCRKVREALGKETGLSVRVVQVWFQNQRAKMKKMQRRGKLDKDGRKKEDGNKKGNNVSGGSGNTEGSNNSNASKKDNSDNYEDSITSNDAFSDDDESLVFDNLDEVDTPDPVDQNIESKHPSSQSSGNLQNSQHISSSLPQHGSHSNPPSQQQSNPYSGNYSSGISTPPGIGGNPQQQQPQPLPAHLPIHPPHPQPTHHPSMGVVGIPPDPHSQQQQHPENVLQNPIDKLYLMQDSYFTQM